MTLAAPWAHDFGAPGSRYRINTPSLVLDLDQLEHNVATMAEAMTAAGKKLRPHIKSHKCSRVALLQRDHGAIGICCATLDEAEVMADAGLSDILLTSPITSTEKIGRLVKLIAAAPTTMIVVDHVQNLFALAMAARNAGVIVNMLVDVELGFGRTGVTSSTDAVALADAIRSTPGARLVGIQAYGGHLQHIHDASVRLAAACDAGRYVKDIAGQVGTSASVPFILSGGGTGTHAIDGAGDWFTEIQAGSYPLMDADYGAISYKEGENWPFKASLLIQATVVSANIAGSMTVDAGTKAIATNGPPPQVFTPALRGSTFEFTGDEHGRIRLAPGAPAPSIGDRIELVASHCDPTVVLHDVFHCVRGDRLVDIWHIDARGRR